MKEGSVAILAAGAFKSFSQQLSKCSICVWGALTGLLSQSQHGAASGGRVAPPADGLHQLNSAMKAACVGELKVCVPKCWSI